MKPFRFAVAAEHGKLGKLRLSTVHAIIEGVIKIPIDRQNLSSNKITFEFNLIAKQHSPFLIPLMLAAKKYVTRNLFSSKPHNLSIKSSSLYQLVQWCRNFSCWATLNLITQTWAGGRAGRLVVAAV